jgi:uncharacterized membrane protein YtjA (UPF0391 family)
MLPPGTRFSKVKMAEAECRLWLPHGTSSIAPGLGHRAGTATVAVRKARGRAMTILKWALIFFLVSIVAGILGFTGISAASADVARFLFYVFVVIFLVLLILGLTIFRV